jgi:hypothetical protein
MQSLLSIAAKSLTEEQLGEAISLDLPPNVLKVITPRLAQKLCYQVTESLFVATPQNPVGTLFATNSQAQLMVYNLLEEECRSRRERLALQLEMKGWVDSLRSPEDKSEPLPESQAEELEKLCQMLVIHEDKFMDLNAGSSCDDRLTRQTTIFSIGKISIWFCAQESYSKGRSGGWDRVVFAMDTCELPMHADSIDQGTLNCCINTEYALYASGGGKTSPVYRERLQQLKEDILGKDTPLTNKIWMNFLVKASRMYDTRYNWNWGEEDYDLLFTYFN